MVSCRETADLIDMRFGMETWAGWAKGTMLGVVSPLNCVKP